VLEIGAVLALIALLIGLYLWKKSAKRSHSTTKMLSEPLLGGNSSTDEFSVEMSAMAASADPVPMAASADPAERGVRLINKRGYQYPAEHVTSAEAEGYGAISTSRSLTAEEMVPVDSDTDTLAHVDSECTVTVVAKLATCKVLVTGEARADIDSIERMLEEVEDEVRSHYKNDHITMDVTIAPLSHQQLNDPNVTHLTAALTDYHVILLAMSAKPVYLAICGLGGKLQNLMVRRLQVLL
jgi:hypothetical protein